MAAKVDHSVVEAFSMPDVTVPYGRPANENAPASTFETTRIVGDWRKRSLDIAVAVTLIVSLLPLFLLVALALRLTSRGPVFYGHERVGRDGRTFSCWKFRTMVVDGDVVLDRHLAASRQAAEEWNTTRKLKCDPRVTAIGAALRQTSLDELPQLLNVIAGEMSLVGPRPVVQDELAHYGDAMPFYLAARPGITGLWQVSGRNDVSYSRRVAMDRSYCENWTFATDVVLLARTFPAVLSAKGTY